MSRLLYAPTTTNVDVTGSAAETTWASWTIPANTLKTNGMVRVRINFDFLNNTGGANSFTLRVKYGATTMFGDLTAIYAANATRRDGVLTFVLAGDAATNIQLLRGQMWLGPVNATTSGTGDIAGVGLAAGPPWGGSAAIDSTANQTLAVTIQNTSNSALYSVRLLQAFIEVD